MKLDPCSASLHKKIYQRQLDALDTTIVQEIMRNPNCEEAALLNMRVERELNETILRIERAEAA